ncbi:MAG: pyridoxine 5'-phosphate synthase [Helicobacter sp.]|nr:pyridoxine 5'-phosphate synthase [Helicobacteraceae bacterium]MDY3112963.1 pyridoxine 5'-phosphate synthase [Helicobacter sp.]
MLLGVNIDHIATLREARKINDPDPLEAVFIAKRAGAEQITVHLREDRRHMHDSDIKRIVENSFLPINVECSINAEITNYLLTLMPHRITLVPENREEVTTEGGLDVLKNFNRISSITKEFNKNGVEVSLFIDPDSKQIQAAKEAGANMIEFHTGSYANIHLMLYTNLPHTQHRIPALALPRCKLKKMLQDSIVSLEIGAKKAESLGLEVAAGHGLNYINLKPILQIQEIKELNIGQSIIARSIFVGLESAIKEMVQLIKG